MGEQRESDVRVRGERGALDVLVPVWAVTELISMYRMYGQSMLRLFFLLHTEVQHLLREGGEAPCEAELAELVTDHAVTNLQGDEHLAIVNLHTQ